MKKIDKTWDDYYLRYRRVDNYKVNMEAINDIIDKINEIVDYLNKQ